MGEEVGCLKGHRQYATRTLCPSNVEYVTSASSRGGGGGGGGGGGVGDCFQGNIR